MIAFELSFWSVWVCKCSEHGSLKSRSTRLHTLFIKSGRWNRSRRIWCERGFTWIVQICPGLAEVTGRNRVTCACHLSSSGPEEACVHFTLALLKHFFLKRQYLQSVASCHPVFSEIMNKVITSPKQSQVTVLLSVPQHVFFNSGDSPAPTKGYAPPRHFVSWPALLLRQNKRSKRCHI